MTESDQILKKASLKSTPFRKEVLDLIVSSSHALHSSDLESALGDFDRITLYRTLKSFEEKGIIHKVSDPQGGQKYAMCDFECLRHQRHHHHSHVHFHCETCKKSYCIDNVTIPEIPLPKKFIINGLSINFTGKCDLCI